MVNSLVGSTLNLMVDEAQNVTLTLNDDGTGTYHLNGGSSYNVVWGEAPIDGDETWAMFWCEMPDEIAEGRMYLTSGYYSDTNISAHVISTGALGSTEATIYSLTGSR